VLQKCRKIWREEGLLFNKKEGENCSWQRREKINKNKNLLPLREEVGEIDDNFKLRVFFIKFSSRNT
jgi:hypothetical protein